MTATIARAALRVRSARPRGGGQSPRPSPLSSSFELPVSRSGSPRTGRTRSGQLDARGPGRPRVSARLRGPRWALLGALGDLSGTVGAGAFPETVLWVTDEPGRAPVLPVPLGREPVDPATIEPGRTTAGRLGRMSAGCVFDGVLDDASDPARAGVGLPQSSARRAAGPERPVFPGRGVPRSGPTRHRRGRCPPPLLIAAKPWAHLFREGFEEPRIRRVGTAMVVSARRERPAPAAAADPPTVGR